VSDVSEEESNYEESGNPDIGDKSEGAVDTIENCGSRYVLIRAATSVAKRRKLEEPASSSNAGSSASPVKTKRAGTGRRIQGRLQNMLSLPFDVLYLVCPPR
jgi:hypothetical protein